MAKDDEKTTTEPIEEQPVGLVTISQETGLGIRLPDQTVIDLSAIDTGQAQIFDYLIKSLEEIKRSIA
jgi:predicted transcriptional regulator